jgi:hypothetical protein
VWKGDIMNTLKDCKEILIKSIQEAIDCKSFILEDQYRKTYGLYEIDQSIGGSWINPPYCCDDCDGPWQMSIDSYLIFAEAALNKINAEIEEEGKIDGIP